MSRGRLNLSFYILYISFSRVIIFKSGFVAGGVDMELDWITPEQAAEKRGITTRQVQAICKRGLIKGVVQLGRVWLIPKDAPKPIDGRTKAAKRK
jgi:hypothetical protein